MDNFKSHSSSLKAKIRFKQKYEVQYTENMPRSLSPEAKQPILGVDDLIYIVFFHPFSQKGA